MLTKIMGDSEGDVVDAYIAAEVDELLVEKSNDYGHEQAMRREAERRIEQLEKALGSCQLVLALELQERGKFRTAAEAALAEAGAALAL